MSLLNRALCTVVALLLLLPAMLSAQGNDGAAGEVAASSSAATAPEEEGEEEKLTFDWELDAYYSNVNLYIPLTDDKVPDLGEVGEFKIYRYLLSRALVPRFFYLELSVNPMPVAGVYLKSNHPDIYHQADLAGDANLIESVTAGMREPYAFSLFFGSLADFSRPGENRKSGNRAYSGYLLTVGDQHILHNRLINDRWLEMEWKIKGDRDFSDEKISWSFRLGSRLHDHPGIADTVYVGIRRSNLDFGATTGLSWQKNSSVNLTTEFTADGLTFLRQEVTFGKRFPLASKKIAISIDLGGIWQREEKIYTGKLASRQEEDNFTVIFRPNILF